MFKTFFHEKYYWVIADISDYKYYSDKDHHYFTLVEKDEATNQILAKVRGNAWKTGSAQIREFTRITGQQFKDNLHVLIKVSVEYHSVYGLQLSLHKINIEYTIGKLEQERLATIQKLLTECPQWVKQVGEKLITHNSQLTLNTVIQKIAVISSHQSDGFRDFMDTLHQNEFGYRFHITTFLGSVQGTSNAQVFCERLASISHQNHFDVLVIVRGGGNDTDFLLFNQFELCRQIAGFPIPIIAGLGHLRNQSLADLLVHSSVKTPSIAAEFIIAHNRRFEEKLLLARNQIIMKVQNNLSQQLQHIARLNSSIVNKARDIVGGHKEAHNQYRQVVVNKTKTILFNRKSQMVEIGHQMIQKPKSILSNRTLELNNIILCIRNFPFRLTTNQKSMVRHFETVFRIMSPANILKKGFAIIYKDGKILTDAEAIPLNSEITIRLAQDEILATTKSKKHIDGDEFNL
jgi:exodeoxyribonuclease VII large subunit